MQGHLPISESLIIPAQSLSYMMVFTGSRHGDLASLGAIIQLTTGKVRESSFICPLPPAREVGVTLHFSNEQMGFVSQGAKIYWETLTY